MERDLPQHISAGPGYSELATAVVDMGIMPHVWFAAPRWSRVVTVAASNIRRKLDYLSLKEGEKK